MVPQFHVQHITKCSPCAADIAADMCSEHGGLKSIHCSLDKIIYTAVQGKLDSYFWLMRNVDNQDIQDITRCVLI